MQPYWPGSTFFSGVQKFDPGQEKITFDFSNGCKTSTCPKLSYHESGRVHLRVGKEKFAEANAAPIGTIQGEEAHILTLLIDDLGKLPLLSTGFRWKRREKDFKCIAENLGRGARVLVYALSGKVENLNGCQLSFQLRRKSSSPVTTFGVRMVGQEPVGSGQLVLLSGWDQDAAQVDNPGEFIYLVCNP